MTKVLLIMSPKSRSGADSLEQVIKHLELEGHQIINDPYDENTNPNELLEKNAEGIDYVIVGGGDGSVNMLLPALVKTKARLIIIPLGTANNLARHFKLSSKVEEALDVIKTGEVFPIDLGIVNNIYFVNVVGLGLSTEVNTTVPTQLKRFFGAFAFVLTAIYLSHKITPFRLKIVADGKTYIRRSWQISVCNGRHYGNGLTVKHDASLLDGKLHALSTEVNRWWQGFALIPALIRGRYNKDHDVSLFEAETIELSTRRTRIIDVDGDVKTQTPAVFSVHRKALNLMVPKNQTEVV
jgi:diacylglycerol kinase (ATP)